jgi:hypothetical protein
MTRGRSRPTRRVLFPLIRTTRYQFSETSLVSAPVERELPTSPPLDSTLGAGSQARREKVIIMRTPCLLVSRCALCVVRCALYFLRCPREQSGASESPRNQVRSGPRIRSRSGSPPEGRELRSATRTSTRITTRIRCKARASGVKPTRRSLSHLTASETERWARDSIIWLRLRHSNDQACTILSYCTVVCPWTQPCQQHRVAPIHQSAACLVTASFDSSNRCMSCTQNPHMPVT